jgi:hypothetical protein
MSVDQMRIYLNSSDLPSDTVLNFRAGNADRPNLYILPNGPPDCVVKWLIR